MTRSCEKCCGTTRQDASESPSWTQNAEETIASKNGGGIACLDRRSYEPIEINAFFRSHTHLPLWEILDKAGFWEQVGIKVNFEFCDSSSEAEAALFSGKIDLISGNHISPLRVSSAGKPIVLVSLADQRRHGPIGLARTDELLSADPRQAGHRHHRSWIVAAATTTSAATICSTYWRPGWSSTTCSGLRSPTRCRASFALGSTKR